MIARPSYIALAALVLLVAAALRLPDLAHFPPGPHYDEAVYLTMTRSIAFGGARFFPIVEAYQGREVLWMYLNAPLLSLWGDSILTLRYASAFVNLLTIALAVGLGRAMFPGRTGWLIGLTAGAALALAFPQVWLARQAFRAVTLPLCQALALYLLWRGLRSRRWGVWLALAGFAAGAALYTYMASRLFPLWLALAALVLLLADRRAWGLRLAQGLVFFGVLALTAAPLAAYALDKPDIFFGRLNEVTRPEESVTLWESIGLHLRMFFLQGDPYLRYNIPERPYFTLPEGLLLVMGLALCAWRTLRARDPASRAAYALALLSPLMIIPSVISVGGLPPSHMRSLGMIPLIVVVIGVGAEGVWRRLPPRAATAAFIALLLVGGRAVGQVYFDWAGRADVYYETDADLAAAAAWLAAGADGLDDTVIYIAARDKGHPTVTIYPVPPVRWLGTDTLFRAPSGMDGLYLFPRSAPPPDSWRGWLEAGRLTDLPLAPDGRTAFEAFRLPGDAPLPISSVVEGFASPYLTYLGMDDAALASGEEGWITTYWRVEAVPPFPDLTPLLEALHPTGTRLFRGDAYMTDTDRWLPGEVLMLRLRLELPPFLPPGDVPLRLAWVGRSSDAYVPYLGGGIWRDLGVIAVEARPLQPDDVPLTPQTRCAGCELDGWRLLGVDGVPTTRRPGERAPVILYWQALRERPPVPQARWLLSDVVTLPLELPPAMGDMPVGAVVRIDTSLDLPPELAAGDYPLRLQAGTAAAALGMISVAGLPRLYDAPPVAVQTDAVFGDSIALHGYTLTHSEAGLALELVWQSQAAVADDYTVFVHRLDADGQILDQRDSQPQNGAYPTSLWLPGEYVVDYYQFPPITGAFQLRVGLYIQDTGSQLPAVSGGDAANYLLIPLPESREN